VAETAAVLQDVGDYPLDLERDLRLDDLGDFFFSVRRAAASPSSSTGRNSHSVSLTSTNSWQV
jgi:hypothetical protein